MKSQAGFDFWPGYVAAISCLVLGLLLVASVVASLTTQLGVLAAEYNASLLAQALRRAAARAELQAGPDTAAVARPDAAVTAPTVALAPAIVPPPPQAPEAASPGAPAPAPAAQVAVDNYLTLIFGEQVSGIPAARRAEIATALRELALPPGGSWRVWATAPDGDLARRRSTFRLMVAVRTFLAEQGIPEREVELRLLDGPAAANPTDIVVRVGPAVAGGVPPAIAVRP